MTRTLAADTAFRERQWGMHDYWFDEALGELCAGVGLQVAIIASSFGLDVDDALASTLPAPEDPAPSAVP